MSEKFRKVTFSLPAGLVDDMSVLASRFGCSRSAFVAELLTEPVSAFKSIMDTIPENPTPADVLRFRGQSAELIRDRIEQVRYITDDLFGSAPK